MDIPWSRISLNRTHASMDLGRRLHFDDTAGEQLAADLQSGAAENLFAGSGHSFDEIAALGKERKPLPRFPLAVSIKAYGQDGKEEVESANIVAQLPGSDPELKNEYVVLSAHIDHVGIGEPINGDRIYNGAMDNASGSALLLDVAASLKANPATNRNARCSLSSSRGEEKGLLGSSYFAALSHRRSQIHGRRHQHRHVPAHRPAQAPDRLRPRTNPISATPPARSPQRCGMQVQPDPEPLRNVFIRSDQYNFIRHGIPSLAMDVAPDRATPDEEAFQRLAHAALPRPVGRPEQPVDLLGRRLRRNHSRPDGLRGQPHQRPQWKPDSFFRRYAQAD